MERLKHNRIRIYAKGLMKTQSAPPEHLGELQRKRLFKLFAHCLSHVPAYAQPETEEFQLNRLWRHVPPLEREVFQQNAERYLAQPSDKTALIRNASGGSTGQPVVFYMDRRTVEHYEAARQRGLSWWGLTPGSRSMMIWGNPKETGQVGRWKFRLKERFLKNRIVVPAFDLTPAQIPELVRKINRFKPAFFYGYPSAIHQLALLIRRSGLPLTHKPKVIVCTAEMLYEDQRTVMASVFGCPVANEYGARDAGILAFTCPEGSLHATVENALFEVLDPDTFKPLPMGETGLLAVTDLHNFVQPRLRYLLGDLASFSDEPCACGRTLPVFSSLEGRHVDMFVLPDGSHINGHRFGILFLQLEREGAAIEQFQIVQHAPERATLMLKRRENAPSKRIQLFEESMAALLPGVEITTQFVDDIPATASGKIRYSRREF